MDTELVALASTGASTLVALLATDAWEQARSAIGALWRRVSPAHAAAVEAQLATTHEMLVAARERGDEQAARILAGEWQNRLSEVLAVDPQVADELRRVLDEELRPALTAAGVTSTQVPSMHARASGHARVYQAGRDQHITER